MRDCRRCNRLLRRKRSWVTRRTGGRERIVREVAELKPESGYLADSEIVILRFLIQKDVATNDLRTINEILARWRILRDDAAAGHMRRCLAILARPTVMLADVRPVIVAFVIVFCERQVVVGREGVTKWDVPA